MKEKLLKQFQEINTTEKWYEWLNEMHILPEKEVKDLLKEIDKTNIAKKRKKYANPTLI